MHQQLGPLAEANRRQPAVFYAQPLQATLLALHRNEAARYEPLRSELNTAFSAAAARTAWPRPEGRKRMLARTCPAAN